MSVAAEKEPNRAEIFTNIEPAGPALSREEVKKRVLDFLGVPPPKKTCGFLITIVLFTREDHKLKTKDGKPSMIIAAPKTAEEDRYRTCTGMVVQMGSEAYQGERFKHSGPWCQVGDWVQIARHDGLQLDYRGKPLMQVHDDKIGMVVDDPSYVQRGVY